MPEELLRFALAKRVSGASYSGHGMRRPSRNSERDRGEQSQQIMHIVISHWVSLLSLSLFRFVADGRLVVFRECGLSTASLTSGVPQLTSSLDVLVFAENASPLAWSSSLPTQAATAVWLIFFANGATLLRPREDLMGHFLMFDGSPFSSFLMILSRLACPLPWTRQWCSRTVVTINETTSCSLKIAHFSSLRSMVVVRSLDSL